MTVITAIFENGIFRPLGPVQFPEGSHVRLMIPESESVPAKRTPEEEAHISRVYEILSQRFDGGEEDVAAKHNEHQP